MTHTIGIHGGEAGFPPAFLALLKQAGVEIVPLEHGVTSGAVLVAGSDIARAFDLAKDTGALVLVSPDLGDRSVTDIDPHLPVLAIFGTRDAERHEKEERLRAAIPHAFVTYVYDAGIAIAEDRPEALARLVADFARRKEAFIVNDVDSLLAP